MEAVENSTEGNRMQIERGMQPNCSELVIRLDSYENVDSIKDELEKINIREYLLKNYYDWAPKEPTSWDVEDHAKEVVAINTLPKKVQKLLEITEDYNNSQEKQDKARKELLELGININNSSVVLLDGDKDLKMPNGTISIYKSHNDGGPAIVGHQHCCWDMFPILKKIADHFGEEVNPYDGGSIDEYERFLNGEEMTDE